MHVSASIGISVFPDDGVDAETLLQHADAAMYHAKKNGRNTFQFFAPVMNVFARERLELESGLRRPWRRASSSCTTNRRWMSHRPHRQRRGADPLAPPEEGSDCAERLHSPRRGNRAHRSHRRMGVARGLPPGARLARRGAAPAHRRQPSAQQFRQKSLIATVRDALAAADSSPAFWSSSSPRAR